MIRAFCINTFIGIHSLFFCLYALVLTIFDKSGRLAHDYATVPCARLTLWISGVKLNVKGEENVEKGVPRVYMSNHQSYFDIFALFAGLPIDFKYVLKKELTRIPVFGFAVLRARHIAIDRENPRKALKSVKQAAERIRNGVSVLIFPEGTRSADGRVQPFKRGGFRLALESGCDIVPVTIHNSRNIVPKGSMRVKRGSITIVIGKPIPISGYRKKDVNALMARVREAIINQIEDESASSLERES
jgi:1-acyl-sn-glycerol-3-phosphate acyltransferase